MRSMAWIRLSALTLLLMLVVVSVTSALNPPTPAPTESGGYQQGHSGAVASETPKVQETKSSSPLPSQTHINGSKQNSAQESATDRWIRLTGIFTGVLAAAAVIQLFIYGRQATYMRRTLEVSNELIGRPWFVVLPGTHAAPPGSLGVLINYGE